MEKIRSLLTDIILVIILIIAIAILVSPEFAIAWAQLLLLVAVIGLLDSLTKKKKN